MVAVASGNLVGTCAVAAAVVVVVVVVVVAAVAAVEVAALFLRPRLSMSR